LNSRIELKYLCIAVSDAPIHSGNDFGSELLELDDSGYSTPGEDGLNEDFRPTRRRHSSGHGHERGFSLAAELAHAGSNANGNASLMAELGLNIEEDLGTLQSIGEDELENMLYLPSSTTQIGFGTPKPRNRPSVNSLSRMGGSRKVSGQSHHSHNEDQEEADLEAEQTELQTAVSQVDDTLSNLGAFVNDYVSTVSLQSSQAHTTDRQHLIEQPLSNLIKTLYEQARIREIQIAQVMEYIRLVESRSGPEWNADFEETEEIAQHDILSLISLLYKSPSSASQSSSDLNSPIGSPAIQVKAHLSELRSTTISILHHLSSIHENAQLNRVSYNDASRKLKSVRTAVSNAKAEADNINRSKAFLVNQEALVSCRERSSVLAWRELDQMKELMDQASLQATRLLSVS